MAISSAIGRPLVDEITSHLVVAALLPALYWLHRRWPIGERYNLADPCRGGGAVQHPAHQRHGGAAAAVVQRHRRHVPYSFPLTVDRLQYEFAKDLVTYLMLTTGVVALNYPVAAKARDARAGANAAA